MLISFRCWHSKVFRTSIQWRPNTWMTLPFIKALIPILNHSESSLHMFDSVILQTFPSQDHTAPDILLRLFLPSEAVRGLFSYDKFHFFQLNTHNQTALDRTLVTSCHSYCDLRAVGQLEPWNIPDLLGVLTPILDPVKVSHCPFVAVLSCVCRARKRYEGRAMGTWSESS